MAIHVNNENDIFQKRCLPPYSATGTSYSIQAECGRDNRGRHPPAAEKWRNVIVTAWRFANKNVPGIRPQNVTGRAPPAGQLAQAAGRGKLLTP
jgi:hypothetical protein